MSPAAQRLAMATLDGWFDFRRDLIHPEILFGTKSFGHIGCEEFEVPDYLNNLNDVAGVEAILDQDQFNEPYSSNPSDHAPMRYLAELAKVCGLKTRHELVITVADADRDKLNFRPGPYPTPIELPASAVVMGHSIPAYGYELCLIRATAAQKTEAILRATGKWEDDK